MKTIKKQLILGLVALSMVLTVAPGVARADRDEGFRDWRHEERLMHQRREAHERWERERWAWEHRHRRLGYAVRYADPYCFTRGGHWAWDGWRTVWVPPHTVCR